MQSGDGYQKYHFLMLQRRLERRESSPSAFVEPRKTMLGLPYVMIAWTSAS